MDDWRAAYLALKAENDQHVETFKIMARAFALQTEHIIELEKRVTRLEQKIELLEQRFNWSSLK